ncbi:MAG: hypothetical protein WCC26_00900 [Terracidiphilus sp.]
MLTSRSGRNEAASERTDLAQDLLSLDRQQFDDLATLASSHHVIVRGLDELLRIVDGENSTLQDWAQTALQAERSRITTAQMYLCEICDAFEQYEQKVAVIKSLDHWPDLGSDLDLFTNARAEDVIKLMQRIFDAEVAPRSWGDRIARKWNFLIPGLREAVEIHIGRLGQMGEQVALASIVLERARWILIGGHAFRTVSIADRLMISTLQRMYRHFYFRLCDIVDTIALADSGKIDFDHVRACANVAGIWEGVATFLAIVSDYAQRYRGVGIDLPDFVLCAARFGGDQVYFAKGFLRIPIVPQSAQLYGTQLAGTFGRGDLQSGARLSLLPWLATAAAVGQKLTGSDKGVW